MYLGATGVGVPIAESGQSWTLLDHLTPAGPQQAGPEQRGPMGPRVSFIIPTYNRARLIVRAVDSVPGQTYENLRACRKKPIRHKGPPR